MRIAVVGAGALGCAYAARLALGAACDVALVSPPSRPPRPASSLRLERIETGEGVDWLAAATVLRAPEDADVVLVAVRYEQLGDVPASVGPGRAPVVVLTPMMPADEARLAAALPGRVVSAMPSLVAYQKSAGRIRYWQPHPATTWIEDRRAGPAAGVAAWGGAGAGPGAEVDLGRLLNVAGVTTKFDRDVLDRNAATTITFYPLVLGLQAAGGIDSLLRDGDLLALTFRAVDDARALAATVGKPDPWVATLMRFVGPWTLKTGLSLARSRSPEAITYVEEHFGRKLQAQNTAMGTVILELARQKGTPSASLARLAARLAGR